MMLKTLRYFLFPKCHDLALGDGDDLCKRQRPRMGLPMGPGERVARNRTVVCIV